MDKKFTQKKTNQRFNLKPDGTFDCLPAYVPYIHGSIPSTYGHSNARGRHTNTCLLGPRTRVVSEIIAERRRCLWFRAGHGATLQVNRRNMAAVAAVNAASRSDWRELQECRVAL